MKNTHDKIKYPVVAFLKGRGIHFARNEADLTICSSRGLNSGFYDGLNLIDSEGSSFVVLGAKKVGYFGFLWGLSLTYGQRIQVELNITESSKGLTIDDLKQKILFNLEKDRHFWNSGGDFNDLKNIIKTENSFKEIITCLTNYFYGEN